MSDGEHINRIMSTPMSPIPADTVRVPGPVRLMIGPAPEGKIEVGLLVQAPPPIGAIRITLSVSQIDDLYQQLHEFITLDENEFTALRLRLHGGKAN